MNVKQRSKGWGAAVLTGALAGLAASLPMATTMMGLHRLLPKSKADPIEPYRALPPKRITGELAERAGVPEVMQGGAKWDAPTWAGHLGYGAAVGGLYPLTAGRLPLPTLTRGIIFAMLVWAGSYLGWIPALDVMPPADEQPARRNVVMILSHMVWGGLLAAATEKVAQRGFFRPRRIQL